MDYAVIVKNLTKKFGDFTAVNDISFNVKKGSIFGFLGPNGSGKSTTIRMICGVLRPTSGSGTVLGNDIVKDTEKVRQNLGYMSQRFSLYEDLTVAENLDFYAGIYSLSKEVLQDRKKELISMAGLDGKENNLAGTLSGGWKQRLALGCALIHKPKILILDEPTAGVDPVSRRVFWQIIHQLSTQGITIFVTTHYMDEAESCDEVGFIFNGNLMKIAPPKQLIEEEKANNLEDIFISYVEKATNKKVSSYQDMKFLKDSPGGES
ncbi:MAG: ABC transporter ATP-binding protein [Ignavibacteriales bacterium]